MRYKGGKFHQKKKIKQAIMKDLEGRELSGTYIEPFIGGGNVAAVMGNLFDNAHYSDAHPDLILMYEAFRRGEFYESTKHPTREEFYQLKKEEPSALRGLVGFGCSFSAAFFSGFICDEKNHAKRGCYFYASIRRVNADIKTMSGRKTTTFEHKSYMDVKASEGDVIYCDPPYANTSGYTVGDFDSDAFWRKAEEWVNDGAYVYVSEYEAPTAASIICEQEKIVNSAGTRCSKITNDILFRLHK